MTENSGIGDIPLKWFTNYLNNKSEFVQIDMTSSIPSFICRFNSGTINIYTSFGEKEDIRKNLNLCQTILIEAFTNSINILPS